MHDLCLLCVIVRRDHDDSLVSFFSRHKIHTVTSLLCQGTAGKKLLELAVGQMEEQERRGLVRCHESWRRDIHRVFHAHRFYLTEEGLCFFFPPGSLAPASEGIPTFCLPYDGQTGPFLPDV